jgi:hypothetical protein
MVPGSDEEGRFVKQNNVDSESDGQAAFVLVESSRY